MMTASPTDLDPFAGPVLAADRGGAWLVGVNQGRGLVHRNALPDRPSLSSRDGTDRPRKRAARPEVVLGSIWVGLSDSGGDTIIVDPRMLNVFHLGCCSPERGYFTAGHGSIWTYDTPTGSVVRWDGQTHQVASSVDVTDPPFSDGPCLRSIAAGAGAVWVTVVARGVYENALNSGC